MLLTTSEGMLICRLPGVSGWVRPGGRLTLRVMPMCGVDFRGLPTTLTLRVMPGLRAGCGLAATLTLRILLGSQTCRGEPAMPTLCVTPSSWTLCGLATTVTLRVVFGFAARELTLTERRLVCGDARLEVAILDALRMSPIEGIDAIGVYRGFCLLGDDGAEGISGAGLGVYRSPWLTDVELRTDCCLGDWRFNWETVRFTAS